MSHNTRIVELQRSESFNMAQAYENFKMREIKVTTVKEEEIVKKPFKVRSVSTPTLKRTESINLHEYVNYEIK